MIKKAMLALYAVILFVFCSCNDDDDNDNINYLDNKLIEGKWYGIVAKDSIIYTFKDNKATYVYYAFVLGLDTLKLEEKVDLGSYLLTDSLITLPQRQDKQLAYKLRNNNNDSLYIKDPIYWIGLKRFSK